jgi:D-tyrosyl-tRNA(Tyr) deacylase
MRAILQRVTRSRVSVLGEAVGEIGPGLLVFVGISKDDRVSDADALAERVLNLRIFEDEKGKMNLSVKDIRGDVLVVSQFTLYGDARRGRRPSFAAAAPAERARELYENFLEKVRASGLSCKSGLFRARMQVELLNDGPVTILLDSAGTF